VFNFLPVHFTAPTFTGGIVAFESAEQLRELRESLRDTHVVRRQGNHIACVPVAPAAPAYGTETTFITKDHQELAMRLLQEALTRLVVGWGYQLLHEFPTRFVSRLAGKDLLDRCADAATRDLLADLHVYPKFVLQARRHGPMNFPGVIVAVKTHYEIDMPVAELIERGAPVIGQYVLGPKPGFVLAPSGDPARARRTVGAVEQVDGGNLILTDAVDQKVIAATDARLEARQDIFADVIRTLADSRATTVLDALDHAVFDLLGAAGRLARVSDIAGRLHGLGPLNVAHDLAVNIDLPLGSVPDRRVSATQLENPTFRFDPAGDKTSRSVARGLDDYGPFDDQFFRKKTPRIAVVAPRVHKGVVENFLAKLLDGVPGTKEAQVGFLRKYHLSGRQIDIYPVDGDVTDVAAYRDACRTAVAAGTADLAIVVTGDAQRHLTGDASPYFVAKSVFMGGGVPVQEVRIETIRQPDRLLVHPLNSIALASYAKLGGIPFVVASTRTIAQELVIGIGSAQFRTSRLSAAERYVGITTVFTDDGNYLLSTASREALYEDYPAELLRSLTECITEIQERNSWQASTELRLIFHVFKPLKNTEVEAVKRLVESLATRYSTVEFAFLQISDDHEMMMFDESSPGVRSWDSGETVKGRLVPRRGLMVPIGRLEALLSVTDAMSLKRARQAAPKPLLLKLDRASTFRDIDYLAGQVYRFTAMSWRRLYPSSRPVTIQYSELIAELLGNLRHVRNWNADAVMTRLRSSRWFL
jgi:hypothetical protein